MGESNAEWGALAEWDADLAETWDTHERLPSPGENVELDDFLSKRHITHSGLLKIGTKILPDGVTLAFGSDRGIKYRRITDGKRFGYAGSEFMLPKILQRAPDRADILLLVEGETDAARMIEGPYENVDIGILLSGAMGFNEASAEHIDQYATILIGTDNDEAGEQGAAKIKRFVPRAQRFSPPSGCKDWCDIENDFPELPEVVAPTPIIVTARELFELEVPDIASWFDRALLPIGGFAMFHGWAKNFKSWAALDMAKSLTTFAPWGNIDPTNEPAKVCVMQFEIPFPYYRERVQMLYDSCLDKPLFLENFTTYSPIVRPRIAAGDKKAEDKLLSYLMENNINVFIMDPIRRMTGGADLNDEKEVRAVLSFIERVCDCGITVIAVHHDNKSGAREGGGGPLSMTGSGAFAGDPDTIISISRPKGVTESQPQRNIEFTVRNGPMIEPIGFEMQPDNSIRYCDPWYAMNAEGGEDDEPGI